MSECTYLCICVQGDDIQKLLLVPVHLGQNKYLIDMRHPDVVVSHVTSCDHIIVCEAHQLLCSVHPLFVCSFLTTLSPTLHIDAGPRV